MTKKDLEKMLVLLPKTAFLVGVDQEYRDESLTLQFRSRNGVEYYIQSFGGVNPRRFCISKTVGDGDMKIATAPTVDQTVYNWVTKRYSEDPDNQLDDQKDANA